MKDGNKRSNSKAATVVMTVLLIEAIWLIGFSIYDAGKEEREERLEKRIMDETVQYIMEHKEDTNRYYRTPSPTTSAYKNNKTSTNTRTSKKKSSSGIRNTYSSDSSVNVDDWEVEEFYHDNIDEFDSVEDAWDYLEDNPDDY